MYLLIIVFVIMILVYYGIKYVNRISVPLILQKYKRVNINAYNETLDNYQKFLYYKNSTDNKWLNQALQMYYRNTLNAFSTFRLSLTTTDQYNRDLELITNELNYLNNDVKEANYYVGLYDRY
jgi:hypothetical protein